ncbi:MAG: hypothetical protein M1824_001464 [Vezdaea acicularis]|nr:MAG: hypothetical protein M1824_001464 [Vezdaea acicularis]
MSARRAQHLRAISETHLLYHQNHHFWESTRSLGYFESSYNAHPAHNSTGQLYGLSNDSGMGTERNPSCEAHGAASSDDDSEDGIQVAETLPRSVSGASDGKREAGCKEVDAKGKKSVYDHAREVKGFAQRQLGKCDSCLEKWWQRKDKVKEREEVAEEREGKKKWGVFGKKRQSIVPAETRAVID